MIGQAALRPRRGAGGEGRSPAGAEGATIRRTFAFLAVLAVVLLLLAVTPTPVTAQDAGTIDGVLVNGTAGGPVPADLTVTVHVVQNRSRAGEHVVRTDGTGRFRVTGLATGQDTIYFPIVDYHGVPFYPDQPIVLADSTPAQTTIVVFEATATPDRVSFDRANMLIMDVSPTSLTVMEMGAAINQSDRVFAADPELTGSARTLRFILPAGATQVSPQAGLPTDTLESTSDGFATTDPIRPGRREIAYSYQLPFDSSTLDVTRTFTLPVGTFTLYLPDERIDVVGPGLQPVGTAQLGGRTFRQYAVQGLDAGAPARFRLTGLPAPLFGRPRELGMLVAGIGTVALVGFVLYTVRRRPQAAPAAETTPAVLADRDEDDEDERLDLIRALAELDERFEAGDLAEAEYRARRDADKARLVALLRTSSTTRS